MEKECHKSVEDRNGTYPSTAIAWVSEEKRVSVANPWNKDTTNGLLCTSPAVDVVEQFLS